MFDGIDAIDWGSLGHAYGSAADVPGQLRALRAADAKTREHALWELFGNIFHQGTRYEASAHAVPFLLRLVQDPATPDREQILSLLVAIAIGYDEAFLPHGIDPDALRRSLNQADDEEREYHRWALDAYEAVRTGVPAFRDLMQDRSPDVRQFAGYALAWFPEEAADSLRALSGQLALERDPRVVATVMLSIGLLGLRADDGSGPQAIRHRLSDPSSHPAVLAAAAIALARLQGASLGQDVLSHLCDAVSLERSNDELVVPFLDGNLGGYAALALAALSAAVRPDALDCLADRLRSARFVDSLPYLEAALRLAFPSGPIPAGTPFAALSDEQQTILKAVGNAAGWGSDHEIFANFTSWVSSYGLPGTRDAFRKYVGLAV